MEQLKDNRSELIFEDYKAAYSDKQALIEANRCLFCYDAPCIKSCPTEINIPQFIHQISTQNVKGAAKTIFEENILGTSCAKVCPVEKLCVGACVYNNTDTPPIQIGLLQRFATEYAIENNWQFFAAGQDSGKSIGIVGAGPAGLSCAYLLRRYGHRVVIYEKRDIIGGLNTTGIAPHKMKSATSLQEIEWLLQIGGIEIKTGTNLGTNLTLGELEQKHDAVFISIGLGNDSMLEIPGNDLGGVYGAVAWIEKMKLGRVDVASVKNCLVIGGGNTALDAVREACKLGIPNVTMLYRGSQHNMTGYEHEWNAAKIEGASACWNSVPIEFISNNQQVKQVKCANVDNNRSIVPNTEFVLPADLVIIAVGQQKATIGEVDGIAFANGCIITDDNGYTGVGNIFAGGDCVSGGLEVVNAVNDGKIVASAINAYLNKMEVL